MTIAYIVLPERQLVLVAWDGIVNWDQWRSNIVNLLGDPAYAAARLQLTDMRTASLDESINDETLRFVVDRISKQPQLIIQKKVAIVPGADWKRAKAFETLLAALGARPLVFSNISTACTWLGVDAAQVDTELAHLKARMRGGTPP